MSKQSNIVQIIGTHQEIVDAESTISRLAYEQTSLHGWQISQYGRDHQMVSVPFADQLHAQDFETAVSEHFPNLQCATVKTVSAPALKVA